ncbi:MAG: hypothetical protein CBD16_04615 [Betaproteobacteria bacterium TMED156]|nr:MAG: hypothetical protein CBD16_04615 [Betaproteobacteria bacterium TMED156]|tara:strand:- start:1 stop:213 length:213 start_codon:yes stop_codon:yes gene_type:complete
MKELTAKFDENISLKDFDKEIKKLIQNFPSEINVLVKVMSQTDCIFVSIVENFDKNALERITWSLAGIEL